MIVALTGGAGFVGKRLIPKLLAEGYSLRALVHRGELAPAPGLETVRGSLNDPESLRRLVEGTDAVIHAGGVVSAVTKAAFFAVNTQGTRLLTEAAAAAGAKRFLFISSLAAREPQLSAYARSKREAERIVEATGLSWDVLRPPAVYGPGDRQLLHLLKPLQKGVAIVPAGKNARASVLYVDDLVAAILFWLRQETPERRLYELDDGLPDSWENRIRTASSLLKVDPIYLKPPAAILSIAGRLSDLIAHWRGRLHFLSAGKLREMRHSDWTVKEPVFTETGWRPAVSFEEGLRRSLEWYRLERLLP